MKTSLKNRLWAVAFGVVTMLVVSLGLCALGAVLLGSGVLPVSGASVFSYAASAAAALLGAVICAKKAGEKRLPLCLASGGVYLLLVFVLRGFLFGGVSQRPWIVPVCVILGSVLGAMATSKQKRRKY